VFFADTFEWLLVVPDVHELAGLRVSLDPPVVLGVVNLTAIPDLTMAIVLARVLGHFWPPSYEHLFDTAIKLLGR
jgi:hypothetical protein